MTRETASKPSDLNPRNKASTRPVIWRAQLALLAEDALPKLYPLFGIVCLFLVVSWFGVWPAMANWVRIALLGLFVIGFVVSLLPLRSIKLPTPQAARKRVETRAQTAHRPLTAQSDQLAIHSKDGDPFADVLFEAHRERMAGRLKHLKSGLPNARMERFDTWGLRAIPLLLLFVAFGVGSGDHWQRVTDAFRTHSNVVDVAGLRVDAWINPPAYTSRAPLFLTDDMSAPDASKSNTDQQISTEANSIPRMPEGSQVLVQYSGTTDLAELTLTDTSGSRSFELKPGKSADKRGQSTKIEGLALTENTLVELKLDSKLMRSWQVNVIPDRNPEIEFENVPSPEANGAFAFSYVVEDDYGVSVACA